MNSNQNAFKKQNKSLKIPFKTNLYYLDHVIKNRRWCFTWLSTACSWKPLLVFKSTEEWRFGYWLSLPFFYRLEVSIERHPRKSSCYVSVPSIHCNAYRHLNARNPRARPENAILINQRHGECGQTGRNWKPLSAHIWMQFSVIPERIQLQRYYRPFEMFWKALYITKCLIS